MITITKDELSKTLEKYLDKLKNSKTKGIGIINQDKKVEAVILPIDEYEFLQKRVQEYNSLQGKPTKKNLTQ